MDPALRLVDEGWQPIGDRIISEKNPPTMASVSLPRTSTALDTPRSAFMLCFPPLFWKKIMAIVNRNIIQTQCKSNSRYYYLPVSEEEMVVFFGMKMAGEMLRSESFRTRRMIWDRFKLGKHMSINRFSAIFTAIKPTHDELKEIVEILSLQAKQLAIPPPPSPTSKRKPTSRLGQFQYRLHR